MGPGSVRASAEGWLRRSGHWGGVLPTGSPGRVHTLWRSTYCVPAGVPFLRLETRRQSVATSAAPTAQHGALRIGEGVEKGAPGPAPAPALLPCHSAPSPTTRKRPLSPQGPGPRPGHPSGASAPPARLPSALPSRRLSRPRASWSPGWWAIPGHHKRPSSRVRNARPFLSPKCPRPKHARVSSAVSPAPRDSGAPAPAHAPPQDR